MRNCLYRVERKSKELSGFSFTVAESIDGVNLQAWNHLNEANDFYFSYDFLKANELNLSEDQQVRYVLVYAKNTPVALGVYSILQLSKENYNRSGEWKACPLVKTKNFILETSKFRLITNGLSQISGFSGMLFAPHINDLLMEEVIEVSIEKISLLEAKKVHFIVLKDIVLSQLSLFSKKHSFRSLQIDPNMMVEIDTEWTNFDQYLSAMKTKYRKQAIQTRKKSLGIERRVLCIDEIQSYSQQLMDLYDQVFSRAKFKMTKLSATYFLEMKKSLGSHFDIVGYFLKGELVAFSSQFNHHDRIEAHVIGLDYRLNTTYNLYLNLLFDYVERTIQRNKRVLILGRTAMEMKSNVGAVPMDSKCYIKYDGSIGNHFLKPIVKRIKPQEWVQRRPFKENIQVYA